MTDKQQEPVAAKQPTRARSPKYPHVGLKNAIQRVQTAHEKIARAPVDRSTLAISLGLTSDKSGTALTWLSTVRQYGLTESRGGGSYGVSDLGRDVLFEQGFNREEALRKAATMPQAFQLIQQTFTDTVPDHDSLVNWLQLRGFTAKAAPVAAKAYRETTEYMTSELVSSQEDRPTPVRETIDPSPNAEWESTVDAQQQSVRPALSRTEISWPLKSGNRFSFSSAGPMTKTDFADVMSIFSALSATAVKDAEAATSTPKTDIGTATPNGTAEPVPSVAAD